MAVTKARKDDAKHDPNEKDPAKGASGGTAPEGYGLVNRIGASRHITEGVATRSDKEESELVKKADEFMKAKKEYEEMSPEEAVKAEEKVQKERAKKADEKPTAPGFDVGKMESDKALPAKETEKKEAKEKESLKKD
jgi:hypothetical protein